ncbi:hypothetical protein B566_EDAN010045 [Ephemera danica]|nr:hypothetical protein B566_EDAN010045 [Ephemera danica]
MNFALLALLFCCAQVFADAVDVTQTLNCDTTVQKQHRILLQYSRSHLITVRSVIGNINDSLEGVKQRKHDVTEEADKSRELITLLQDVLYGIKNNGSDGMDENKIFAYKLRMENGITDLKLRLSQLDCKLKGLKIEKKNNKRQLKQMQKQERKLEISISYQEHIRPLDNNEMQIVEQLGRSQETLELERQWCQFKLDAFSFLMEAKLEQVALTNNTQMCNTKAAKQTTWAPPTDAVILSTGTYFFNTKDMIWSSAREHCQSLGMDLVAIETDEENEALAYHLTTLSLHISTWTSGCYSSREAAVVWSSTGHKVSNTNWKRSDNHGNKRDGNQCVVLFPRHKIWLEIPVNVKRPSICEKM